MPWHYRTLGLSLISEVPLEGLILSPPPADKSRCIHLSSIQTNRSSATPAVSLLYTSPFRTPAGPPVLTAFRLEDRSFLLEYGEGISFTVSPDGSSVQAQGLTPDRETLFRTALYGQVMGLVLRLRGVVALHASAVAV